MYTVSEFISNEEAAELFNAYGTAIGWESNGLIPALYNSTVYPGTFRYWVKLGIIPRPHHNFNGHMFFDRQTILDLVMGVTEPEPQPFYNFV